MHLPHGGPVRRLCPPDCNSADGERVELNVPAADLEPLASHDIPVEVGRRVRFSRARLVGHSVQLTCYENEQIGQVHRHPASFARQRRIRPNQMSLTTRRTVSSPSSAMRDLLSVFSSYKNPCSGSWGLVRSTCYASLT
jgi:hypothetical protein